MLVILVSIGKQLSLNKDVNSLKKANVASLKDKWNANVFWD